MGTITFDTPNFTRRLRDAGFDEKQAEVVVRVLSDAQSGLVTRDHFDTRIRETELKLEAKLAETKADLIRWVVGVGVLQLTFIAALLLKLLPA